MELVLLQDVQGGYGSNWARIANTSGVESIQIGDRFREQGFGQGAEELEVAGLDISKVGGASRLFFNRAGNATQPEVHRLGCVLELTYRKHEPIDPLYRPLREQYNGGTATATSFIDETATAVLNNSAVGIAAPEHGIEDLLAAFPQPPAIARRRGRPPGSKNKPKE